MSGILLSKKEHRFHDDQCYGHFLLIKISLINRISFFKGYQIITTMEREKETSIPIIATIDPPPRPGPMYSGRYSKKANASITICRVD
ncbi:MAG: hypothetical protein HY958_04860 [Bacteroidia bacterium]|nr:hypothetical protein [Bacteroidia bacterium]